MTDEKRTLTDDDIKALSEELAEALRERIKQEFYYDLGKGIWALVWRGIILGIIGIAAYGAAKNL